jgi:hypothetical protein
MMIKPLRPCVALIGLSTVKSKALLSVQEKLRLWTFRNGGEGLA